MQIRIRRDGRAIMTSLISWELGRRLAAGIGGALFV
jgi:hypothetical protein